MAPPAGYSLVFESSFGVSGFVPVASNFNQVPNYVFGSAGVIEFLGRTPYAGDFGDAYFTTPSDSSGNPSPFTQSGTSLIINPYMEASDGHWRSGMLSTVGTQGSGFSMALGYWEASYTIPNFPGTWPSFWLNDLMTIPFLGEQNNGNHYEIDITEDLGHNDIQTNQHFHIWSPNNGGQVGGADNSYNAPNGWTGFTSATTQSGSHTYGCLIATDFITFFMDDVQIFQTPSPSDIASHKFYALLTYALGSGFPISIPSGQAWMWIQYIRAYSADGVAPTPSALTKSIGSVGPRLFFIGHPFPNGSAISTGAVNTHIIFVGHPFPDGSSISTGVVTPRFLSVEHALVHGSTSGSSVINPHFVGIGASLPDAASNAKGLVTPRFFFPFKPPIVSKSLGSGMVIPRPSFNVFPQSTGTSSGAASIVPRLVISPTAPGPPAIPKIVSNSRLTSAYTTVGGDMFDSISYQIYKSERFSPALMRENPNYAGVIKFDAGVVLNVPPVASSQNISNVPWGTLIVT